MLASFATVARISKPTERGELFAVTYLIGYLALSVPAVAAGFATATYGLRTTTIAYAVIVIALSLTAFAVQHLRTAPRQ